MAKTPPAKTPSHNGDTQLSTCPRCNGSGKVLTVKGAIGDRVRLLRLQQEKTQAELAKDVGVSRVQIVNIEMNHTLTSFRVLIRLAEIFDVSVDYLLGRSDIRIAQTTKHWRKTT